MKLNEKTYDIQGCMAHGFGNPRELDFTSPVGVEQAELQLINAEGKIVWTKMVSGVQGQITIDTRSYKSGAYIFRLLSDKYIISEPVIIE